jgi:hypothetical protein
MGASCGTGTPSRGPDFIHVFSGVWVTQSSLF